MPDPRDREHTPVEGVRIIGAEEARAALGDDARAALGDEVVDQPESRDEPVDEPDSHDPGAHPRSARFPEAGPTWSRARGDEHLGAELADVEPDQESSSEGPAEHDAFAELAELPPPVPPSRGPSPFDEAARLGDDEAPVTELPHWTEPPTGRFGGAAEPEDDDLEAWAVLSGSQPRFRSEDSDWAEGDFAEGDLTGEEPRLGALDDAERPDDDEAFAAEVAAHRRRGGSRRVATRPRPVPAFVEPDVDVGAGGRDLPTALVTAGVLAVLALFAFNAGTGPTAWLAAAVVGLAALELANGLRAHRHRPAVPLALVGSAGLVLAAYEYGAAAYPVVLGVTAVATLLWYLWEVTPGRPVDGVASTLLAVAYVGALGGFAGLLLQFTDGVGLLLGVAICTIAYDVVGFFVGSQFGRSRIAPRISPNKTFEGTLAGMTASVVFGWGVVGLIAPWNHGRGLTLGVLVAVGAFVGDLCESMIKRDLGIKDFGSLLPGHGGVLDRFDSLLFALPIAYYLAVHFL